MCLSLAVYALHNPPRSKEKDLHLSTFYIGEYVSHEMMMSLYSYCVFVTVRIVLFEDCSVWKEFIKKNQIAKVYLKTFDCTFLRIV